MGGDLLYDISYDLWYESNLRCVVHDFCETEKGTIGDDRRIGKHPIDFVETMFT